MTGVTDSAETAAANSGQDGAVAGAEASCPKTALEIGVFFDGTWNNAANAAQGGSSGSYANAQTNIRLLERRYKNGPDYDVVNENGTGVCRKFRSRYVQGVGTVSGDDDSKVGGGVGMGSTGVEATVARACLALGRDIAELSPGIEPEEILLDVFGFSRGAAAARYFVNAFRQGWIDYNPVFGDRVRGYLPEDRNIKIRFVGIFDTVASIGLGNVEYNHGVNIHLKPAQADTIFHITAANEYRVNFRLNHNLQGGGEHFEMTGAHADIGGGYRDAGDRQFIAGSRTYSHPYETDARSHREVVMEAPAATPQQMLPWVTEGWVRADEAATAFQSEVSGVRRRTMPGAFGMPQVYYEFDQTRVLDRPWVRLGLSRVAMAAMYDRSQELAKKVPFRDLPTTGEYAIPADLAGPAAKIRARTDPTSAEKLLMVHDYTHASANPNAFGFGGEGDRERHIYWNRPGGAK